MTRFALAFVLWSLAISQHSFGSVPLMSLDDMVDRSDWIFLAQVDDISTGPVFRDAYGELSLASLEVKHVLRGFPVAAGLPENCIELLYRKDLIGPAPLTIGRTYLLFWKNGEYGPSLAPGEYGALRVDDERNVDTSIIAGMNNSTTLDQMERLVVSKDAGRADVDQVVSIDCKRPN